MEEYNTYIDQEIMSIFMEASMDNSESMEETDFLNPSYHSGTAPLENNPHDTLTSTLTAISVDEIDSTTNNSSHFEGRNEDISLFAEVTFASDGQTTTLSGIRNNDVLPSYLDVCQNDKASTSASVSPRISPETTTPITSASETPVLPPCRICGEKASGFHYGVNTCEACKGFFRRSILKTERKQGSYKCPGNGHCAIVPGRRSACSACRYKKCLDVGMSKNAIKTGRYTYAKRTRDTKEIQKLEAVAKSGNPNLTNITEIEIISIISRLVDVQRRVVNQKIFDKASALQRQKYVYKSYRDRVEMLGSVPAVSRDLFDEILDETGIDLDDRKSVMFRIAERMDIALKNMIQFLKALPDISNISVADQSKLIKGSFSEFWYLANHKMINPDFHVFCNIFGNADCGLHKEEIKNMFKNSDINFDDVFTMARSMQKLELTEEEIAVVRGIAVTFTDKYTLEQPDKIQQIQWKMIDCLRWLSKRNNNNPEQRFYRILDRLTALRGLAGICTEVNKERSKWPAVQKYPLVMELIKS